MFTYSYSNAVIPTLTFTKAELVYTLITLLKSIPPTDDTTPIEMVEVRHFLNQNRDLIAASIKNGSIAAAMPFEDNSKATTTPAAANASAPSKMPSMRELQKQFPSLSEEEIKSILADSEKESAKNNHTSISIPNVSTFIGEEKPKPVTPFPKDNLSKEEQKNKDNSEKFASMLGSF